MCSQEPRLVLVSLLIGWKSVATTLNQSRCGVMQNQSNLLITFDTQLKTALVTSILISWVLIRPGLDPATSRTYWRGLLITCKCFVIQSSKTKYAKHPALMRHSFIQFLQQTNATSTFWKPVHCGKERVNENARLWCLVMRGAYTRRGSVLFLCTGRLV